MDCTNTVSGWFDFKMVLAQSAVSFEVDVYQTANCTGSAGGTRPYPNNKNHSGRCGFVNVAKYTSGTCMIDNF